MILRSDMPIPEYENKTKISSFLSVQINIEKVQNFPKKFNRNYIKWPLIKRPSSQSWIFIG